MLELRWVLLILGLLVLLGVYLWGRGLFRGGSLNFRTTRERAEPRIGDIEPDDADDESKSESESEPAPAAPPAPAKPVRKSVPRAPEQVVAIRLVHGTDDLTAEAAVLAMRKMRLEHGEYGIFHRMPEDGDSSTPVFSVSNLTAPGSFDLTKLSEMQFSGLSIFMVLPGDGDPVERFDKMLDTARKLARELESELFDDKGSSWSIQRERYIREEMIQYKHRMQHG